MADEFMKGLAALTGPGLVWMVLAGWYQTPSFEGAQLFGAPPKEPSLYGSIALVLIDSLAAFAVLGALTFWVLIPAFNQIQAYRADQA